MSHLISKTKNLQPDEVILRIAHYAVSKKEFGALAQETAQLCLMDALGCALLALNFSACTKLLGPVVPGAEWNEGVLIPGTNYRLDPVQGAFNLGTMIRWLDFNDTWLAQEWGHPSDNFGGILATAAFTSRHGNVSLKMSDVFDAGIKAYEIQGVLALENAFNRVGLDHVLLVKLATTAVVSNLLGASKTEITNAISNAFVDGQSLRTYRHTPNTGSRKSWAAGDATARGVRLALMAKQGEMGYPSALTTPIWGFQDASYRGQTVILNRPLDSYVMENILFKISFPAEFHAQTAVECAIRLHAQVLPKFSEIQEVVILTQESALRIIDKSGPLHNPADRDHCLQYMTAIGLIFGNLTAEHYENKLAADPRIDWLRSKMKVVEDKRFTLEYLDPEKRSIGNAIQVFFKDGTCTEKVEVDYPLGHRRRRDEGLPQLRMKFEKNLAGRFSNLRIDSLIQVFADPIRLNAMPVLEFLEMWAME